MHRIRDGRHDVEPLRDLFQRLLRLGQPQRTLEWLGAAAPREAAKPINTSAKVGKPRKYIALNSPQDGCVGGAPVEVGLWLLVGRRVKMNRYCALQSAIDQQG
jgi:hypothetical protein